MADILTTPTQIIEDKVQVRRISRREAMEAASRLRTEPDGTRYVVRFSTSQRLEHLVLIITFTLLAVTGLSQTYSNTAFGHSLLNSLGGISVFRQIHRGFAVLFALLSLYHLGRFFYRLVVYRLNSKLWPTWQDFSQFDQMLRLNLGLTRRQPGFDRYNFEEKLQYWLLVWGAALMGITGLVQMFPVLVTDLLPGSVVPVANALHRWEAILAVLVFFTWHLYHTVLKKMNKSMFTGKMTMEEMEKDHPLELAYLERAAAVVNSRKWPVQIEVPVALTIALLEPAREESAGSEEMENPAVPVSSGELAQ